ncbi:MAG TPA: hypothetical protein VKJ45_14975 [Blastocatellia bacterium]|nr:hypothetical protein [Blastocatellia bacterium]
MKRRHLILSAAVVVTCTGSLLGLGTSRAGSQSEPTSSSEHWEYLIVNGGGNVNLAPTDNPSMRKEPGAFAREDFALEGNLDKLGKKGWELVTVADSARTGPTFIFKRRK